MARGDERSFREIERQTFERVFHKFLYARLFIAPTLFLFALGVALLDPAPWRLAVVSGAFISAIAVFWFEWVRLRGRGTVPGNITFNLVMIAILQLVIVGVTGALESPVMPVVFALATIASVALGPGARIWPVLGVQIAGIGILVTGEVYGFLPDVNLGVFGGGGRAGHNDALLWTSAGFMILVLLVVGTLSSRLRGIFDGMVHTALEQRADLLATHIEQGQALQGLTAEIAHELKNPLASIKGLGALLARDVPEGRPAERLAVLREEVDRMQGILEEFLNFSRPLVPLSLRQVDLGALTRLVADLHEGVARARGVVIRLSGEGQARCDHRKIEQVLINLVQNGLDASPPGGVLELRVGEGEIRVHDQGAGLDEALRDRVFEPGVTHKEGGSGLGLTVARAIARQHGGELTLEPGQPGCVAVLTLPPEGP